MDRHTMPIPIRDRETDRLAREVAALTGETITDAIGNALRERLVRERARRDGGRVSRLLGDRRPLRPAYGQALHLGRHRRAALRRTGPAPVIVDSSALLAILFAEPDRKRYAAVLDAAVGPRLSAVNFVEAAVRVDMGGNPIASDAFDDLIKEAGIMVEPVTEEQAHLARRAYRVYGRGSPARLNLGDCFAYALAKATSEPLLFKCDDFRHTDIEPALSD